jgi:hypothetical protein
MDGPWTTGWTTEDACPPLAHRPTTNLPRTAVLITKQQRREMKKQMKTASELTEVDRFD